MEHPLQSSRYRSVATLCLRTLGWGTFSNLWIFMKTGGPLLSLSLSLLTLLVLRHTFAFAKGEKQGLLADVAFDDRLVLA